MLTKDKFMQEFGGHASQYASFMLVDVSVSDVIRVLNEYDDGICAGSCVEDGRSITFEVCKVNPGNLLAFMTVKLHCIGYATEDWEIFDFFAKKDGMPYEGFVARWDEGSPCDNEDGTFDAFFIVKDKVSGAEFFAGGGCLDKDTYLGYKTIVHTHMFDTDVFKIGGAAKELTKKQVYTVAIKCSESDNVVVKRILGTSESVKKYLAALMLEDMENDSDNWDGDKPSENDVYEEDGRLKAEAMYRDYHIDYVAVPEPDIMEIDEDGCVKEQDDISIEDEEFIQRISERGLSVNTSDLKPGMISYVVYYNGIACGTGTISDEGLGDRALMLKILKLINAEAVLDQMEAIAG